MMAPKTIVVVDDNPQDMELTIEAMKQNNLADLVVAVNDGVEAMEYLRCQGRFKNRKPGNPAVLLLDIKMPRMDGVEVLKAVRGDSMLKNIPAVMFTSSREVSDVKKCYSAGANAYIVKPVVFKDFLEVVRDICIFWALQNELPPSEY